MAKSQKQTNKELPYMKYFIDGLPPELVKKAEKELGETEEIKEQSLKQLKKLIKTEPDFEPCMEDTFLLRFLRTKKYRVDKAFKTLKNYYTYKATYSGIVTDFTPSDVKDVVELGLGGALEYRDQQHAGIGYLRFTKEFDLHDLNLDEVLATALVCGEMGINMESIAVAGYVVIVDFKGVSFNTIRKFASPIFVYRAFTAIQDCIPCRIKGYHIVNQPYFFHLFLTIAKTLMTEKLSSRWHLHGTNMESLYKYIPQEILPEELGGKQGPVSEFALTTYAKNLYAMEEHFIKQRKFGYKGKTLEKLQKDNHHAIVT